MRFLLDTNTWIRFFGMRSVQVLTRFSQESPEDIVLCSVVLAELQYGRTRGSWQREVIARQEALLAGFVSLPFDDAAARIAGDLRAHLAALGTPIGPYDLQIAAIALANDVILVTHNTREFPRVPNLRIEDWEASP